MSMKQDMKEYMKKNTMIPVPKCTRVEVIDEKGRSYVNWKPTNQVSISWQDEGRTLKIFVGPSAESK